MPGRHDPFAPHRPAFPRERLRIAKVPAEQIAHLEERYDDLTDERAVAWFTGIRQQSNGRIRRRFTMPTGTDEEVRAALAEMGQAELRDLATAEGLTLGGTLEQLRARLVGEDEPDDPDDDNEPAPAPTPVPAQPSPVETPVTGPEQPVQQDTPAEGSEAGSGDTVAVEGQPAAEGEAGEPGAVQTADGEVHEGEIPADAAAGPDTSPEAEALNTPTEPATVEQPAVAPAPTGRTSARTSTRRG